LAGELDVCRTEHAQTVWDCCPKWATAILGRISKKSRRKLENRRQETMAMAIAMKDKEAGSSRY
jgi:hypothetical protein